MSRLSRFSNSLSEASRAAQGLAADELPDALGQLERLRAILWTRLKTQPAQREGQPAVSEIIRAEIREFLRVFRLETSGARGVASSKPRSGDPLLTIPQAAEAMGIRPSTVRAWVSMRKFPCVRIGRAVRIKESDVKRFVDKGYTPARPWDR